MDNHQVLLDDLRKLLTLAVNYEFHDFKSKSFAFPKIELALQLARMRANVLEGRYDNSPKDK